jgi:hypothetical protein
MLSAFAGMRTIASGRKQTALPRDLLHTQTHLLQFATQSGGNLLIPHKAMPPAAKS